MASPDSISKELECSICCEEFDQPKIVGQCGHSFCQNCLQQWLKTKLVGGQFPCPFCCKQYPLPASGVDGLTTNFMLVNIIEKYRDLLKDLSQMKWKRCAICNETKESVSASLACAECDGISLCEECGEDHVNYPATSDHEVTGICEVHGKPLQKYCKTCHRPICSVCLSSKHSNVGHDVKLYRDVVVCTKKELIDEVGAVKKASGQLGVQDKNLSEMQDEKTKSKSDLEKAIFARFDADAMQAEENIIHLSTEIEYHHSEMERKTQEKRCEEYKKERILRKKKEFLGTLENDYQKDSDVIAASIAEVASIQDKIKEGIGRSEKLTSEKILRSGIQSDMLKNTKLLQELSAAANIDRVTPLREATRKTAKFGLNEDYITSAGQFSSTSHTFDLTIPDSMFLVFGVVHMSNGRLTACGNAGGPRKVWLWNLPSVTPTLLMIDDAPLMYIAAMDEDDIVVLRRKRPILRVMNTVTNAKHYIDVNLTQHAIDKLWSVEVDDREHFFVTYGEEALMHIAVIDNEGIVLQDIETGYEYLLTFCSVTEMVVICTNTTDTISKYRFHDNSLTKIISAPHGVKGFECTDICSGSLGEIYVVGWMNDDAYCEIRVYQMLDEEGSDKEGVVMRRIEIKDIEMMRIENVPRCSVQGNHLVVGCKNKMELFKLSK